MGRRERGSGEWGEGKGKWGMGREREAGGTRTFKELSAPSWEKLKAGVRIIGLACHQRTVE